MKKTAKPVLSKRYFHEVIEEEEKTSNNEIIDSFDNETIIQELDLNEIQKNMNNIAKFLNKIEREEDSDSNLNNYLKRLEQDRIDLDNKNLSSLNIEYNQSKDKISDKNSLSIKEEFPYIKNQITENEMQIGLDRLNNEFFEEDNNNINNNKEKYKDKKSKKVFLKFVSTYYA